jgi:hypothetical protein
MGDPERLLGAGGDGDALERELLGSIRDVSPPPDAKGAAWDVIAVQVAAVAAAGAGTAVAGNAAAQAAAGAKLLTAKVLIGVALIGSTFVTGGYWVSRQVAQRSVVGPPAVRRAPSDPAPAPLPPAPSPGFATAPWDSASSSAPCLPTASPAPPDRLPRVVDGPRQRNLLGVESRMLTEARAQLRNGDPRAAMSTLERLQTRFPKGVLMQERDVLTIQVLAALGDVAGANRRAKEFLEAYPQSPHAPQLRRFAGDP